MHFMIYVVGGIIALAAVIVFLCSIYRVADIDKALIITGGKEPVIKVSGGSFVIPIFRKAQYFDLCMLTVTSSRDEIKTKTSVPIVADWTAQIRPDISDPERLKKAIISFKERGSDGIINDVKLTLTGAVRDIVSSMTPEEVLRDKTQFAQNVMETVADEMKKMGMELVSLNIQDITDNKGYYDNIAALDLADKKREAENKLAVTNQEIRNQKASSEQKAAQAELESKLAIAEKERDNSLKIAEFKAETDKANADAAIAGRLQSTIRQQEVAAQEGRVEVVRQEQANLAAQKQKEVEITRAETKKAQAKIDADAAAEVKSINADAEVLVAEKNAKAIKITAEANAERVRKEGQAGADVLKIDGQAKADAKKAMLVAEAEAEKEKMLAEAQGIEAKGLAEAEGIKAQLLAEAEGMKAKAEAEKQLAEARASNDKVNLEIEKAKIFAGMQVEIATNTATIMAKIGENAEFVNIGGAASGQSGNVLIDTMMQVPSMMKVLNAQNEALNGQSYNEELQKLGEALFGPVKGILSHHEAANVAPQVTESNPINVSSSPIDTPVND